MEADTFNTVSKDTRSENCTHQHFITDNICDLKICHQIIMEKLPTESLQRIFMETLPIEIVNHVMRFLPLEDIHSCSLVCKKWYSALQDPSINSRLMCRVDLQNDARVITEVANFARSRLISHLTICDSCPSAQSCEETMFWMDKDNKFEMITTLYLNESVVKEHVKILMSIAAKFVNVKVVEMYSSFLFEAFADVANRDKVICALQNIPQLHLIVEDNCCYDIPTLSNMKLNFSSLLFEEQFQISRSFRFGNELVTAIRSEGSDIPEKFFPLHDLIAFCSQHQCAVDFQFLYIDLPGFKLSEVLEVMRRFPKFSIKLLEVSHSLNSIMEEDCSSLQQISNFLNGSLEHLVLYFTPYDHNWLSKDFFSSLIIGCKSLKKIKCHGKFNRIILGFFFSCCHFAKKVSIWVSQKEEVKCFEIKVTYKTALNSHLKKFCFNKKCELHTSISAITYVDLLYALPLHLREFSIKVDWDLSDPTILMKLNDRCPFIRKLTIKFLTALRNPRLYFLGEMGKLEELALISCDKNVMENMSFPCLKMLTLTFKRGVKGNTVFKIVSAFREIKSLNLSYWTEGGPQDVQKDTLKEGLSVLTELEELKITEL